MNRFFLLPLLVMPLAAPCMAAEFARTDSGCQVMNWNASRVSPSYTWTGSCVDGYAAGNGVLLSFVAGSLFSTTEGSMTRGVFNGPSKIQWADGTRYEGQLTDGTLTGRGVHRAPDGTVLRGVFQNSTLVEEEAPPAAAVADTAPSEPSGNSGLNTTLSMLGALATGAGQGYASSDALRASQLSSLGNALSQAAGSGASSASASTAAYTSGSISSEVANMHFSGGCLAAQQKGEVYLNRANQRAESQEMGVCSSARHMRMAGEIAVRVAEQCQNTADGPALQAEGERMIQEAEQTMSGSCG